MLESAQDARHAKAIQAAHAARGAMVLTLWKLVFARKSDRRLLPVGL